MNEFLMYGPCALYLITLIVQLGIFAKSSDLTTLETKMTLYINEHFLRQEVYLGTLSNLQQQMSQMQNDINSIKNILIDSRNK